MKTPSYFGFGIIFCMTLVGLCACAPTNHAPSGAVGVSVAAAPTVDQTATVAAATIEAALATATPTTNSFATPEPTLTVLAPTSTPQPTPNLDVTETAQASWLATAVAATLTAQAQSSERSMTAPSTEALTPASLERIRFPSGSTAYTFSTQLTSGLTKGYVLRTLAGQRLFVVSANVTRSTVLDPDHIELTAFSTSTGQKVFPLAKSGDYTLIIAGDGRATITIDIPPLPERIEFTLGSASTTFTIQLTEHISHAYVLWVSEGQQIFVQVSQPIELFAFAPAGNELIPNLRDPFQWQFTTTQPGDHYIFLKGVGDVTVTITIPPL